jgi:hypothetical protein
MKTGHEESEQTQDYQSSLTGPPGASVEVVHDHAHEQKNLKRGDQTQPVPQEITIRQRR